MAERAAFANSALLLIDIQTQWTRPYLRNFPNLKRNLQRLVRFAREHRILIVHIYADYNKDSSAFWKNVPHHEPQYASWNLKANPPDLDMITPLPHEKVIYKWTFDGFFSTTLQEYLTANQITRVYGAGVATSVCVLNTLHGAFVRGFKTFIVKDCCADSSKQLHELVIARYWHMFPIANIGNRLRAGHSKL